MNNRTVIVITGPTASGKTSLGVSLALALGTEVVSADSMQLYRGMDIGSAKPTREEMRGVPHHMIDVADPAEDYSVSRWVENAAACCDALLAGGKTPVIVGGTGLYIESLLSGRDFSAAPGDSGVREALGAEYDALGGAAFREKLRLVDPERAEKLAPGDKKRLVRAMEVYTLTGETITAHDGALLAREGKSGEEIQAILDERREKLNVSFVIDTLEYLRKGGRCSTVAALGANLLKLKPCIEVHEGKMSVAKKYRGTLAKAIESYVTDRIKDHDDFDKKRVFITDSGVDMEIVETVEKLLREYGGFEEIHHTLAGSTISGHCGPGCLGILYYNR